MSYNRDSFLTGLAAARCLRGWGPATRADFAPEAARSLAAASRIRLLAASAASGAESGGSELQESGHTAPYVHFTDGSRLLVWDEDGTSGLNEGGTYNALITDAFIAFRKHDYENNTYTVHTTNMTGVTSREKTDYDGNRWTFDRTGGAYIRAANGESISISMTSYRGHQITTFMRRRYQNAETGAPQVSYNLWNGQFGSGCNTTWALSTGKTQSAAGLNRVENAVELLSGYGTFVDGADDSGVTAESFRNAFYEETTGTFRSWDYKSAVPDGTSFPAAAVTMKAVEYLRPDRNGGNGTELLSLDNSIWDEDVTKPKIYFAEGMDLNFVQGWSVGIELNRIALGRR